MTSRCVCLLLVDALLGLVCLIFLLILHLCVLRTLEPLIPQVLQNPTVLSKSGSYHALGMRQLLGEFLKLVGVCLVTHQPGWWLVCVGHLEVKQRITLYPFNADSF